MADYQTARTVAAVSTPPGKGGVALIRVSGDEAAAVADRVFLPAGGKALSALSPRRAVYGRIVRPGTNVTIDTGIAVLYRAPASFTGEDVLEFSCHGGTAVTRAVLSAVLEAGAEPAGRGEFTRRAFLNGKMTLTEAEAVGLLIDADTESRRALAAGAASGNLSRAVAEIADDLTGVLTALYAAIDYPEEDVGDEGERAIAGVLAASLEKLRALIGTYRTGAAIAQGIPCVVAGLPNSGKSSLYNRLLGRDDAIVTDVAGTTRDVLTASADVGGATLLLSDTAGIRETEDVVEKIGVTRSRERLAGAALILLVADGSVPFTEETAALFALAKAAAPVIVLLNKCDLPSAPLPEGAFGGAEAVLRVSALTGAGMDTLTDAVSRVLGTDRVNTSTDAVVFDARQEAALSRGASLLADALSALDSGDPTDAVCTLCESAVAEISGTDGRAVNEEIIDGIFSRFCVGK